MKTEQWILLASAPLSVRELKKLIARYWYRREDEDCIEVSTKTDPCPPYKVYQDGKLMEGFRVIVRGGRYRFEGKVE